MSNTLVLNKILSVREKEKEEAQIEKIEATDYFEKIAQQLYEKLKAREQAEETLEKYIQSSTTITKIKEQSSYIDSLNKKIMNLQQHVQNARKLMEDKQRVLTEAHVEVKKIEKMIEQRERALKIEEKKLEMNVMDEISIRQFNTQVKNR